MTPDAAHEAGAAGEDPSTAPQKRPVARPSFTRAQPADPARRNGYNIVGCRQNPFREQNMARRLDPRRAAWRRPRPARPI